MYNMFQQLRFFAYNQLLSKKVSSTKVDDVEGKDVPNNSKNNVLQEISANLEESERILLEKSTISCRRNKSKSYTDIKDSSKTVLNTAKKCLSLSDLKRHIACMNIKKIIQTQKNDIMKPNISCSSEESAKKNESMKSRDQRRHKHITNDESPSSFDLFGFYKNRRRKHISPYELYVQSVKPAINKNFIKLKKCGSKIIRHERSAKHIPLPLSHHALKVITSNHAKMEVATEHEDGVFDSLQCFKNRDEINYSLSLPRQDHKKEHNLPSKNESVMCHLKENHNHTHHSKKKRRVSYSIPKDHTVDVACGNVSADQSIKLPVVITQELQSMDASADQSLGLLNLPPRHEFGCSPVPCLPKCECILKPSQSVIEEFDNATQTSTCTYPYRTRKFSCYLPKPYKKSVQFIANLNINNPDPKSMVKCILICLVVTVWSPILLAIGLGWLLSYPLRPCIVWERNLQYKRKVICACKNPSSCHKPGLTKIQYLVQACTMQPLQRQNQKQETYAWRTLSCCRRRDLRRNYCISHANCRTKPLYASQHRATTITNFFHSIFCSCDKIHHSNVSSFRARRNMVALKKNTSKEPTLNDKRTRHPIIECSPRRLQNSEAINIYPIKDIGTTTEPKRKSVNLQTHHDQIKSDDDIKWSSFFSPLVKLVENYLVHSKYMTPKQQTFSKKCIEGQGLESKHPQWQCFQKPTTDFSKYLRGQPSYYSRGPIIRKKSAQCSSLLSKETNKINHKKQKVINFEDELFQNTETSKSTNKKNEYDPLNQKMKRKNLFWKVSQTAHETETNFDKSTQKPVGYRKNTALYNPRCRSSYNEETKSLQLVSSNCKSPVCDKTKQANTTIVPTFPLSKATNSHSAHNYIFNERPASGHIEPLCHETKEVNTTTEINKNLGSSGDTKCSCDKLCKVKKTNASIGSDQKSRPSVLAYSSHKQINKLTQGSSTSKYPISSDAECSCGLKGKKAVITVGMNQKSKSNSSCQCHLIKTPDFGPGARLSDCKCPISGNTKNVCPCDNMKHANVAVKKDQKSKSTSSCQCQLIKPIKLPPAGSAVCKCFLSSNLENLCHNCHKTKKTNAAVETDRKSKSNTSCQCHLIKSTNFEPAGLSGCKFPNSGSTENLRHKKNKTDACVRIDRNAKPGSDLKNLPNKLHERPLSSKIFNISKNPKGVIKINTSCQCHLLKPTQLPPDVSSFCECPNIANPENLCQNCHKKQANKAVKTGQFSELSSICDRQRSKHINDLPRNGSQEAKSGVGTDPKSKFSYSCERAELNKEPYDFIHTPFQQDALNVYKLGTISGDTDSLKSTKKRKKHRKNKTASNKCIHTPEYLNVCSEVCGNLGEKKSIAHTSLLNSNEKCHMNKQKRTSKCKANSPRNTKNVNKCIGEPIEAKQLNSLKSPFNDNDCSGQRVTVECSMSCCNIRGLNKLEANTDKVTNNSWITRYQNVGTNANTCFANIHRKMKKETQSADKLIQAAKTKICADKSQICACLPSEQKNFSFEERKSCSSQTFKKATFATPFSLSYNEQTSKKRKPTRAKYLAYTFYDFIVGKNRRKKGNKQPFETIQPSGILIKTSDYKKQNYETESPQCYGDSTEPKSININTALSPINTNNKIGNFKSDGRKNNDNKSMEFSYFTMLKDLIDSKTLQNRNFCAQYNKSNRKQPKINSPCNNMLEMQNQYPCVPSDSHWVPPLVPCACVSPRVSSVHPLERSVITECKCPVQIPDPNPSLPTSCSCEHDVSGQKKQQKRSSPHNSNIKETNQSQGFSPQTYLKLDATRSTNTPNTNTSFSKRSTNIQQKLSKLRSSITAKSSKISSQTGLNISKTNEQKVSSQPVSNILEGKEQKLSIELSSQIPKTKKSLRKAKVSRGPSSGKGDGSSNKPGRRHLKSSTQAIVTGKGDNSLSFNDKRDLIKMCFKRKVKLTPSLVKCLSDSINLVSRRKHFPRIIEHIKLDKCCKQNKRHRIKLEYTGTAQVSKATGIEKEYAWTQINKPTRHDNIKSEKGMGDAGQYKFNECECKRNKRKIRKNKPPHSSKTHHTKIHERKSFWVQHNSGKNSVTKKPVKIKIHKKNAHGKKTLKSSRKQTSNYSEGGDELRCSDLYLATLRERPWFWIYKLLPKCYPSFLRFRLCSKTICTQCAFSLTCCLWAPIVVICLVCYEVFSCCQ